MIVTQLVGTPAALSRFKKCSIRRCKHGGHGKFNQAGAHSYHCLCTRVAQKQYFRRCVLLQSSRNGPEKKTNETSQAGTCSMLSPTATFHWPPRTKFPTDEKLPTTLGLGIIVLKASRLENNSTMTAQNGRSTGEKQTSRTRASIDHAAIVTNQPFSTDPGDQHALKDGGGDRVVWGKWSLVDNNLEPPAMIGGHLASG